MTATTPINSTSVKACRPAVPHWWTAWSVDGQERGLQRALDWVLGFIFIVSEVTS